MLLGMAGRIVVVIPIPAFWTPPDSRCRVGNVSPQVLGIVVHVYHYIGKYRGVSPLPLKKEKKRKETITGTVHM